jgi:hypothetical protein
VGDFSNIDEFLPVFMAILDRLGEETVLRICSVRAGFDWGIRCGRAAD